MPLVSKDRNSACSSSSFGRELHKLCVNHLSPISYSGGRDASHGPEPSGFSSNPGFLKPPGTYTWFYQVFSTTQNCQTVFLRTQSLHRILLFYFHWKGSRQGENLHLILQGKKSTHLLILNNLILIWAHRWATSDDPQGISGLHRSPQSSEFAGSQGRSHTGRIQFTYSLSMWTRFDCFDHRLSSLADLAQPVATVFKAVVNLWTVSLNMYPYPLCRDLYVLYLNTTVYTALVEI